MLMNIVHKEGSNFPVKTAEQTLTEYAETLSDWYLANQCPAYRKEHGQYFTPRSIAEFMAQMVDEGPTGTELRILDPGAGIGMLAAAICDWAALRKFKKPFSFDLYENSDQIIPLLELNMQTCKKAMLNEGLNMFYTIFTENFILANAARFNEETGSAALSESPYDLVICNPPYYKLRKVAPEAVAMKRIVKGQPNMYMLFMAVAARLVREGGQLIFLTPRSYCSGKYFAEFRKWFFGCITPVRLHIFGSRRLLDKDSVLQEMLILKGEKSCKRPDHILISQSHKEPAVCAAGNETALPFEMVVVRADNDTQVRIPLDDMEQMIAREVDKFKDTLLTLGLRASTGAVVPFRAREYLLNKVNNGQQYAPLIWMENIIDGMVVWPLAATRKPAALLISEQTNRMCIENSIYVLIKRFSAKEGRRRINAGVIMDRWLPARFLAIENHVNYVYKTGSSLNRNEAYGLTAILNSTLYNRYFQMANGNTQVNASDLNRIPLPSADLIERIGKYARKRMNTGERAKQRFIMRTLGISPSVIGRVLGYT